MQLSGEYRIPASRDTVWRALNDPEVLRRCIPGCEELDRLSDTEYRARIQARIGSVKSRFSGRVTLSDLDPPNRYTIEGNGEGPAGFARGGARVELDEDGGATVLRYTAEANVGGRLAQVGSRLVQSTARKMADDFFQTFSHEVAPAAAPAAAAPAPGEPLPEKPERPAFRIPVAAWVYGFLGVVVLLYFLLS